MKTITKITVDLADVVKAGGVKKAIIAYCMGDDDTDGHELIASGVIGPSFSTSGPGSGWSMNHDASDFAAEAMEGGAVYYVDADDGRMASSPTWTSDIYHGEPIVWTDDSVIELECPSVEDAIEHPKEVAKMAQAVIDYHSPQSDAAEWKKLIVAIRDAAKAVEDIDVSDFRIAKNA